MVDERENEDIQERLENDCMEFLKSNPEGARLSIAEALRKMGLPASEAHAGEVYLDMAPKFPYVAFGVLKKGGTVYAVECFLGYREGLEMLSYLGFLADDGFHLEPVKPKLTLSSPVITLPAVVANPKDVGRTDKLKR